MPDEIEHQIFSTMSPTPISARNPDGALIDDLIVVANDKQVRLLSGHDQPEKVILCFVGILKLIDTNIGPPDSRHPSNSRPFTEELAGQGKQAAEVQSIRIDQCFTIAVEQAWQPIRRPHYLLELNHKGYADPSLSGISGSLRTPNGSVVIARDVTPLEAYNALLRWFGYGRAQPVISAPDVRHEDARQETPPSQ